MTFNPSGVVCTLRGPGIAMAPMRGASVSCSAVIRGLSTCHSRTAMSASSAAYSAALSTATQSKVILDFPEPVTALTSALA